MIEEALKAIPIDCDCKDAAGEILGSFGISINSDFENWIKSTRSIEKFFPNIDLALRESILRDHTTDWSAIERTSLRKQLDEIINIGGVYLGVDKLSHFTGSGYLYYEAHQLSKTSGFGNPTEMAIKVGITGEKTIVGRIATGIFSYADLEANFQGFIFGLDMCRDTDPMLIHSKKGWKLRRKFDIRSYVNPDWDESYNPSFFYDGLNLTLMPKSTAVQNNLLDLCKAFNSPDVQRLFNFYDSINNQSASETFLDSLISLGLLPDPSPFDVRKTCKN